MKKILRLVNSIIKSIGQDLQQNEHIQKNFEIHPRWNAFWRTRFSHKSFWGRSFTLLSVSFIYILLLFFGIIEDVLKSDLIVSADFRWSKLMILFRSPQIVKLFLWITSLGRWQVVLAVTIILSIIFWLWQKRAHLLGLWVAIGGGALFTYLGKIAFRRTRPINPVYTENSFAFPSGHATMAIIVFGFLCFFLIPYCKKVYQKAILLTTTILFVGLIGFSRIYLNVHFLSDIWGGYLLGMIWLIIGISFYEWKKNSSNYLPLPNFFNYRNKFLATLVLAIALIATVIVSASLYHPAPTKTSATNSRSIANLTAMT